VAGAGERALDLAGVECMAAGDFRGEGARVLALGVGRMRERGRAQRDREGGEDPGCCAIDNLSQDGRLAGR